MRQERLIQEAIVQGRNYGVNGVQIVGKQPDATWILGGGICISSGDIQMSESDSLYMWISRVFSGPGIPSPLMECSITLPLTTGPLQQFLNVLA